MGRTDQDNLLVAMHRYAHRQDENFTTEAFAHLLRELLANEPDFAVGLLAGLTDGHLAVPAHETDTVSVRTQVTTDMGRPDVEIRTLDHLVYVEVKTGSAPDLQQMARYREALSGSGFENATLALLTNYLPETDDGQQEPYVLCRWYQIGGWLRKALGHRRWRSAPARYVTEQFLAFLKARGMTMERVTWEMETGVKAFWHLMGMLREALDGQSVKWSWSLGKDYVGYNSNGGDGWLGVYWDDPTRLLYSCPRCKADDAVVEALCSRTTLEGSPAICVDLNDEDVHFFARTQASQMQFIEHFVREGQEVIRELTKDPTDDRPQAADI